MVRYPSRQKHLDTNKSTQTKKDQLALALLVVRTDPILTAPGGWGLRNPEPKGPGQRTQVFSQCRAAVAWRKSGDTMIPSNDPVTVCRDRVPPLRVGGLLRSSVLTGPLAAGNSWRDYATIMIAVPATVFADAVIRMRQEAA